MKQRFSIILVSLVVIAGMFLGACAPAKATTSPVEENPSTVTEVVKSEVPAVTPVTIKVMSFFAYDNPEVEQAVVSAFEAKYPDIKVDFEAVPMSDIFLKYKTLIAGGSAPDVMSMNYENAYMFGALGSLEPLDSWIKDTNFDTSLIYKTTFDMFKVNGVQYSIPATFSDVVLFYNKNLFDAAKVEYPQNDWTAADMKNAAIALTKDTNNDGKIDQWGYSFPWWPMVLAQYNATIWSADGKTCTLNSPEGIKAFQTIVDARYVDIYAPTADNLAEQGDWDMFIAGKLAMYPTGPWAVQPFNDKITNFHYDIANMPPGDVKATLQFANSYAMAAASQNKDAAWKFIAFATGPEGTKIRQDGKYEISPVKQIAEQYYVANLAGDDPEHAIVFMEALDYAVAQPVHAKWQQINDAITPELDLALSKSESVTDALNNACEGINSVLSSQ
jgi:multiple sugar transport system substrate-binding protein